MTSETGRSVATASASSGMGCLGVILSILAIVALFGGLPTTWGELHIDFFPPGVYLK